MLNNLLWCAAGIPIGVVFHVAIMGFWTKVVLPTTTKLEAEASTASSAAVARIEAAAAKVEAAVVKAV